MADNDANVLVGYATISVDGVDCGHLKEGVTVRMARDYYDVEGQHRVGVIKKVKTKEALFVATTIQEPTLTRLKQVWDQGTGSVAGTSLTLGVTTTTEHTIVIVGPGPSAGTRTITLYRAVSINEGAMPMSQTEEAAIPIEFECLKDMDNGAKFGLIVDTLAA